jgi:hypothetical protein
MTVHQHFWRTLSTHPTSEGLVTYQSCPCGHWRILMAAAASAQFVSSH